MLKAVKWLVIVLVLLLAVFVAVGMFLPSDYAVERTTTINAPPEQIHRLVGDLARWPEWSPWEKLDPTIVTTLGPKTQGVGASQSWTGKSGFGELELTKSDPQTGIAYEMTFDGRHPATGVMRYQPTPDGTQVTWEMQGDMNNFIGRYMALMMDAMVGPNFETGLAALKEKAEDLPPEPEMIDEELAAPEEAVG